MKTNQLMFAGLLQIVLMIGVLQLSMAQLPNTGKPNLAQIAKVSSSRGGFGVNGLNDGKIPVNTINNRQGGGNNRPQPRANIWVQYDWEEPVSTSEVGLFWWNFNNNVRLPENYRISYWNGNAFAPVENIQGLVKDNNQLNISSFKEIKTTRMRVELDSADRGVTSLLEWVVVKTPNSPNPKPIVSAGIDRDLIINGKTYLDASVKSVTPVDKLEWQKISGPGTVKFDNPNSLKSTASFSSVGNYILGLTATEGSLVQTSSIAVKVHNPPPVNRLDVVYTKKYKIDNKLWNDHRELDSLLYLSK